MRDRAWLRSFLHLEARSGATVPMQDIERQEDTVLRALDLLEGQPGLVLADEVGMGKTYEALGVMAARREEDPTRRMLVLTPGPDLNRKWTKELAAFCDRKHTMYRGFVGQFGSASTLRELLRISKQVPIWVAPVTMFAGSRANKDLAYLLSLFFHYREMRGNQVAAAFRRYRDGQLERVDLTEALFLDEIPWTAVGPVVERVMCGDDGNEPLHLARLFEERQYGLFDDTKLVDHALTEMRFRLIRALLPEVDLLVVDEAHKLKNADTIRARAVREAFHQKFDKAVFLTATPFQLDVAELRQILRLFAGAKNAPEDLEQKAAELFDDIKAYQAAYDAFYTAWRRIDGVMAEDFARLFAEDPSLERTVDEPTLAVLRSHARKLLALKRERIEPGFRRWMIRSLREDKRQYRKQHRRNPRPEGGDGVPFMIYERFIAELFRARSRTHKAAVQMNMVSSYGAARDGAILSDELRANSDRETERYRQLLRRVLDPLRDDRRGHPKLGFVLEDALEAADRNEKTLIFCARTVTATSLKKQLDAAWRERLVERWRKVDPGATADSIFRGQGDEEHRKGRHTRIRDRLHRTADLLYLALRERYVDTVCDLGEFARDHVGEIVELANRALCEQHVNQTRAERLDWALVKRCVEHAAATLRLRDGDVLDDEREPLERLADPRHVLYGFDHVKDELEPDDGGAHVPRWSIERAHVATVLERSPHLWLYLKGPLHDVPHDMRVQVVERLARYLTHQEVPFLAELLAAAKEAGLDVETIESRAMLRFIDRFWTSAAGRPWTDLLRSFLMYFGELDEQRQKDLLEQSLAAGQFARDTLDADSRQKLQDAFNTPLFPMVLVANEVMQEGLDLHHRCARIVHHDLAWNPAQLEQRVGRIDRLGSLTAQRRRKNPSATLDVIVPLISGTIDERLDRTVRMREKWLEFLLGATPTFEEDGTGDEDVPDLPPAFAEALKIELGPGKSGGPSSK